MKQLAFILLLSLSSCGMFTQTASHTCSQIHYWTLEQQGQAKYDLTLLPEDSVVFPMFEEYASLRNQARECLDN